MSRMFANADRIQSGHRSLGCVEGDKYVPNVLECRRIQSRHRSLGCVEGDEYDQHVQRSFRIQPRHRHLGCVERDEYEQHVRWSRRFDQDLAPWYITLDSLTIADAATDRTIGTLTAQNTPLNEQNPVYSVADINTDDSSLFEIASGNTLQLKDSAPLPRFVSTPFYTVTLTAEGSLFWQSAGGAPSQGAGNDDDSDCGNGCSRDRWRSRSRQQAACEHRRHLPTRMVLTLRSTAINGSVRDDAGAANATTITAAIDPSYRLTDEDKRRHIAVRVDVSTMTRATRRR